MTTSDQIYFTVLDVKKLQLRSMYRGFEPVFDEDIGEDIQVLSSSAAAAAASLSSLLARLYESTGRAIAVTPASALALASASALL